MSRSKIISRCLAVVAAFVLSCGLVTIVGTGIEIWSTPRTGVALRVVPFMAGAIYLCSLILLPYALWTMDDYLESIVSKKQKDTKP